MRGNNNTKKLPVSPTLLPLLLLLIVPGRRDTALSFSPVRATSRVAAALGEDPRLGLCSRRRRTSKRQGLPTPRTAVAFAPCDAATHAVTSRTVSDRVDRIGSISMRSSETAAIYAGASSETEAAASPTLASLASPYVIFASDESGNSVYSAEEEDEDDEEVKGVGGGRDELFVWRLVPIDYEGLAGCDGAAAVRSLRGAPLSPDDEGGGAAAVHVLRCRVKTSSSSSSGATTASIVVTESHLSDGEGAAERDDAALLSALGRILVQWSASQSFPRNGSTPPSDVTVSLPDGAVLNLSACDVLGNYPVALFGLDAGKKDAEMSEMVDSNGKRMGAVPRALVHTFNILHRGVGIVVSRDHIRPREESDGGVLPPDIYCHRRTDTKRIFPSMYDMFVGGVSTAGEGPALTAAREVAEEYGLRRALDFLDRGEGDGADALSEPLFECTVCTSYNRCVVTVFTYHYRTDIEVAKWQPEEVAWGDFVPYDIVERAARMDIDRLKDKGEWPGTGYKEVPHLTGEEDQVASSYGEGEWKEWNFVPDGLLVWEAWVAWRDSASRH